MDKMHSLEEKLTKYRAQKEREAKYNKFKENFRNNMASYFSRQESNEGLLESETNNFAEITEDNLSDTDSLKIEDNITENCWSYMDLLYYTLCFTLWAIVFNIFITLQFGTVYFILSVLIGIYLNTRTRPKLKGEISAYSVFNKNCESIDGTIKAEDFERELRYGPLVVH